MNNTILAGAPVGNKNAAGKRKFLHPEIAQRHALEDHEVAAATKYLKGERTSAEFDRLSATVSQAIDDHEHFERTGTMKASEAQEDNVVRAVGTSEGAKKGWEHRLALSKEAHEATSKAFSSVESHGEIEAWRKARNLHIGAAYEYKHAPASGLDKQENDRHAVLHQNLASHHDEVIANLLRSNKASDITSTEFIHCRASSAAGEKTFRDSITAGEVVHCTESIPLFVK